MKKLLLIFTCFFFLPLVNGAIFEDNFNRADSSTVGNGWVETAGAGTNAEILSNRLRLSDTSSEEYVIINQMIDTNYSSFNYSFDYEQSLTNQRTYFDMYSGDTLIIRFSANNNGNFSYVNSAGSIVDLTTRLASTVYDINIVSFNTETSIIYINGNDYIIQNRNDNNGVDKILISTTSSVYTSGYAYIDNLIFSDDDGILTITATDNYTSLPINNFNISLYYPNGTFFGSNYTTSGVSRFNLTDEVLGFYDIYFLSDDYLNLNTTINYTNTSLTYEFETTVAPNLNLSFYDEITKTLITNVSFELIFPDSAVENTTLTGHHFAELNNVGLLEIVYNSEDYYLRKYFINITPETNEPLSLYLINESSPNVQEITYLVTDQAGVNLEGAIISALRRYTVDGNTNFEVVEMSKSGIGGDGAFHLEQLTPDYKFLVSYNNNVVLITEGSQIFKNSIILKATTGTPITENLYNLQNVNYDLDYDNYTYSLTWADGNGVVEQGCLTIYRYLATGKTITNSSCISASNGVISLGIGGIYGDYEAVGTVVIDGETYTLVNEHNKLSSATAAIGVEGLFWTAILVVVAATIAVFSPVVSIIFVVAVLVVSSIMGFASISQGSLMFIGAIAGFIIYSFRRGGA